jgi:hypothetical protein
VNGVLLRLGYVPYSLVLGDLRVCPFARCFVLGGFLGLGMGARCVRTMGDGIVRLPRLGCVSLVTRNIGVSLGHPDKQD